MVVAHAVPPARLQQAERPLDVGAQERPRVVDGVVVVALRGAVNDGVGPGHEAADQLCVADIAHDELDPVGGQAGDVLRVAGVGELVQHGHADARVLAYDVVHEVGPDEAAAAGDDDAPGLEGLGHGNPLAETSLTMRHRKPGALSDTIRLPRASWGRPVTPPQKTSPTDVAPPLPAPPARTLPSGTVTTSVPAPAEIVPIPEADTGATAAQRRP